MVLKNRMETAKLNQSAPKKKRLRDNRLLLNLYQLYKYIIFFPILGLSTILVTVTALPTIMLFGEKPAQIWGRAWARINCLFTPMFVKIYGGENIDKKQSYVIAANHQSQYDIFAVYGYFPVDFRWVMKMELRRVPVMGYIAGKGGHIYIDRSDPQKAFATLKAAGEKIKDGTSIFFFPEGTRGPETGMLPFKRGAFQMAMDLQLPILPVTIIGTRDVLPNNSISLFPGKAKIIVHKPVELKGQSMEELMRQTKLAIESGFTEEQ